VSEPEAHWPVESSRLFRARGGSLLGFAAAYVFRLLSFTSLLLLALPSPLPAQPPGTNRVLELDGKDSYVELPPDTFKGLTNATVEGWVQWDRLEKFARFFISGDKDVPSMCVFFPARARWAPPPMRVKRQMADSDVGLNIRKSKNWEILADSERTQIGERAGQYLICEPL
jgi:hypothetical protein